MKRDYFKIFILRTVGNFFLLSALAGVVLTFAPAVQAEINFRYDQILGRSYIVAGDNNPCAAGNIPSGTTIKCPTEPHTGFGTILANPPLPITPVDTDFGIVIPKINANSKIIPNVDPGNYDTYIAALKQGVAHAQGTVYPGQIGNSVLFAHSVGNFWEVNRWNAVFYLLRELAPGDEVDIFYKNKRYIYTVYGKTIVDPSNVQYLEPQADFSKLTLQTCWPPGTTLERLLVFARLKRV